ncbi:MAG: hypothetical protein WD398_00980 [Cyclobacteriaceae bacterium]
MINFNPYRNLGAIAILGLAACSPNFNASRSGEETDNLYFMASDAKIATEFAVKNNNPENFKEIEEIQSFDQEADNFSAKNVNPEYIAKYQRSSEPVEEGTVYFDDSQNSETQQGDVNVNAYDNYRGANGGGTVNNNYFMNPMMGMGMYPMGMYDPFWGMGMYDPFWGSGFGMRPGFNLSLSMGFGWGSPFMRSGFGWGSPFMRRGMGFYDPFWGSGFGMRGLYGYGDGMWGNGFYNYSPVIIIPGGNEGINRRQIVQGGRPYRSSALTNSFNRARSTATQPSSMRSSARRDAVASTPNGVRSRTASSRNSFDRSQNDYYNTATATPARRNVNSPAMNRSGSTSNRSSYATPSRTGSSLERRQAPANINSRRTGTNNSRSVYGTPSRNSSTSPSYNRNRSTSPSYQRSTSPSRSRSTYSAPSRSSSTYSAPSRSSSGSSSRGGGSVSGGRRGN